MIDPPVWQRSRRVRARLVTGALAHLVGGAADLVEAFTRYGAARLRERRRRARSVTPPPAPPTG